jgi:hypothetical protein
MEQIIKEYARSGAFEVWRSRRDNMLAQGRAVNEKFMKLPIPEQDMVLDAAIAEDVVIDFLRWVESHHGFCLTKRAIDPPSACEGCGVVPGQGEHDRSCPVVSAGN